MLATDHEDRAASVGTITTTEAVNSQVSKAVATMITDATNRQSKMDKSACSALSLQECVDRIRQASMVTAELLVVAKKDDTINACNKRDFTSKSKLTMDSLDVVSVVMEGSIKKVQPMASLGYAHSRMQTRERQIENENQQQQSSR